MENEPHLPLPTQRIRQQIRRRNPHSSQIIRHCSYIILPLHIPLRHIR